MIVKEKERTQGRVHIRHVITRDGRPAELTPRVIERLKARGVKVESITNNLVVNVGRFCLAQLLGGAKSTYINRVQLGDTVVSGSVAKSDYPADLSDTTLVREIRTLGGDPGATFDLDSTSYPGAVTKIDATTGTPGTLTAGIVSLLTDAGQDFVAAGVTTRDTVTVTLGGEDYTLGVKAVNSTTEIEVENPGLVTGAVGYTVETPGTQVLFSKVISGDNFPEAQYGPETIVHEAGLLFTDGALFNRVVFAPEDDSIGLILQPTDIDGTRIDVQLDWLITF
jgi:hypothetical protein